MTTEAATRARGLRDAPEAYPSVDTDEVDALAAQLSEAESDSDAISMLFDDSVQIVYQQK